MILRNLSVKGKGGNQKRKNCGKNAVLFNKIISAKGLEGYPPNLQKKMVQE